MNFNVKGSDGKLYNNGIIDQPGDGWLAAVLSGINPEWNYGQAGQPVPTILAKVSGLARNMPANLGINDYIAFRQNGVGAIRFDNVVGPIFQSGITTSLVSGQTTMQRRRMADNIQGSIATALAPLAKLPMTTQNQDNIVTETDSYLHGLLSPENPPAQRINGYSIDLTANTLALNAQGIFLVLVSVQLTPTMDFIALQFQIANNVVIATQTG